MRKFLFGIFVAQSLLLGPKAYAGQFFSITNPTCLQKQKAKVTYTVGVVRYLADYYLIIVKVDASIKPFNPKRTRLVHEKVSLRFEGNQYVYQDEFGKVSFAVSGENQGEIGHLNWDRDLDSNIENLEFTCGPTGYIVYDINTREEARLSVTN